jgi:hypothetical protein
MLKHSRFLGLAIAAILGGCSEPPLPPSPSSDVGLKELAEVYRYRAYMQLPVAQRLTDLSEHWDAMADAYPRIEGGEYVVHWGVGITEGTAGANRVIAYEKQAPSVGGAVLLGDGTVKQVTAAEFQGLTK